MAVAGYIDRYNQTRRHSACEMKPPIESRRSSRSSSRTRHRGESGVKTDSTIASEPRNNQCHVYIAGCWSG